MRWWTLLQLAGVIACNSSSGSSTACDAGGPLGETCHAAGGRCIGGSGADCPKGISAGVLWSVAPASEQDCLPVRPEQCGPVVGESVCCLPSPGDASAGPFCSYSSGPVPPPTAADFNVTQCTAPRAFCVGPLEDAGSGQAGWGCCADPALPDGAPPAGNDCVPATTTSF